MEKGFQELYEYMEARDNSGVTNTDMNIQEQQQEHEEEEEDRYESEQHNDDDDWDEIEMLIHECLSEVNNPQVEEEKKEEEALPFGDIFDDELAGNGAGDNLSFWDGQIMDDPKRLDSLLADEVLDYLEIYEMYFRRYAVDNKAVVDNGGDDSDIDEGKRMDYNLPDSLFSDDETFFWAPLDFDIDLPSWLFDVEETSIAENEEPTKTSSTQLMKGQ